MWKKLWRTVGPVSDILRVFNYLPMKALVITSAANGITQVRLAMNFIRDHRAQMAPISAISQPPAALPLICSQVSRRTAQTSTISYPSNMRVLLLILEISEQLSALGLSGLICTLSHERLLRAEFPSQSLLHDAEKRIFVL